jgi:hypothetical protein
MGTLGHKKEREYMGRPDGNHAFSMCLPFGVLALPGVFVRFCKVREKRAQVISQPLPWTGCLISFFDFLSQNVPNNTDSWGYFREGVAT